MISNNLTHIATYRDHSFTFGVMRLQVLLGDPDWTNIAAIQFYVHFLTNNEDK